MIIIASSRDSSMCTELDTRAPLFFVRDQLYLSTATDNHYLSFGYQDSNRVEFSSSRQFRRCKLYDNSRESECDLLLELNPSGSPIAILGEVSVADS